MRTKGDSLLNVILTYFTRPRTFPISGIQPLTYEERNEFRKIMAMPVFQKVLNNAYTKRPSTAIYDNKGQFLGVADLQPQAAINRLHQLQGWDMLEAAMFAQAEEPTKTKRQVIKETYPDAGITIN